MTYQIATEVKLAGHTTMQVGGNAAEFVVANSERELIEAVADCDLKNQPVFVLGGGSNVIFSDQGFAGRVVLVRTTGIELIGDELEVQAGHNWNDFVQWTLDNGFKGLETLIGIPGTTGGTPIQNVGAYGSDVSNFISVVNVYDRLDKRSKQISHSELKFSYRDSVFKIEPNRYLILSVRFKLVKGKISEPIIYDELAQKLKISLQQTAPVTDVANAVLELRRSKGMVLDESDSDTKSVGSFFLNPRISVPELPVGAPHWMQSDGKVKVSAAWLIQEAGFSRGFEWKGAAVSTKHTLALCNRNDASSQSIMDLAEKIQTDVYRKFNIKLQLEPQLIN